MSLCSHEEVTGRMGTETAARPRFSRGQESPDDAPSRHVVPNFARGQLSRTPSQHKGAFGTGQERVLHHPEDGAEGRFSRGQDSGDA